MACVDLRSWVMILPPSNAVTVRLGKRGNRHKDEASRTA
jgi:hypothetical protein